MYDTNPLQAEQMFIRGCAPGILQAKIAAGEKVDLEYMKKVVRGLSLAWTDVFPRQAPQSPQPQQRPQQAQQDPAVRQAERRVSQSATPTNLKPYESWKDWKVGVMKKDYGGEAPTWEQLVFDEKSDSLNWIASKMDPGEPGGKWYAANLKMKKQAAYCLRLVQERAKAYEPPQQQPQGRPGEPTTVFGDVPQPEVKQDVPWEGDDAIDESPF